MLFDYCCLMHLYAISVVGVAAAMVYHRHCNHGWSMEWAGDVLACLATSRGCVVWSYAGVPTLGLKNTSFFLLLDIVCR